MNLKQTFQGESGEVVAYVEDEVTGCKLTDENFTVSRYKGCEIICTRDLCTPCIYRSNTRVNRHRLKSKVHPLIYSRPVFDSTAVNVRHLARKELEEKYSDA